LRDFNARIYNTIRAIPAYSYQHVDLKLYNVMPNTEFTYTKYVRNL